MKGIIELSQLNIRSIVKSGICLNISERSIRLFKNFVYLCLYSVLRSSLSISLSCSMVASIMGLKAILCEISGNTYIDVKEY